MALTQVNPHQLPCIQGARVAIITSKWHKKYVDRVAERCTELLEFRGAELKHHQLPGTYEFPHAVRVLKESNPELSAIVCIGIILKGETLHFDMIFNSCAYGLTKVALEHDIIVINGIIPATDMDQIRARASNNDFNKGIELACATIETIAWTSEVRQQ